MMFGGSHGVTQWRSPGLITLLFAVGACASRPPAAAPEARRNGSDADGPAAKAAEATPLREAGAESLEPLLEQVRTAEAAALTGAQDQQAWVQLAGLLQQAHRTQEAARAAWRAVEIEPNFFSWTSLGNVLIQGDVFVSMGAAVGAFQAYKMAAQQAPEPTQAARNFLSLAYRDFALGHDDQAMELIAEAETLAPREPLVFFDRACVLAAQGNTQAAQVQATRALALLDEVAKDQTPSDPALAQMRPIASAIAKGEPLTRPGLVNSGEMLPERFWAKPPTRGTALSLNIDAASDRFFPLIAQVAMRLRVPTDWAHRVKATDKAVHIRLAPPGGEASSHMQIVVFPIIKESFNLKQAAEAGRQAAEGPRAEVTPLMPLERAEGLAFWFERADTTPRNGPVTEGSYARLWQGFAFTRPFVISATWLGQRPDERTREALLALLRSFEVFRVETSAAAR